MMTSLRQPVLCLFSLTIAAASGRTYAQTAPPPLTTVRVASGLMRPLYVTAPPGDYARLFIVEQRGSGGVSNRAYIRVLDLTTDPPTLLGTPFLSITGLSTGSEQGLLGLAFHPNYFQNGYFYVNYTNPNTQIVRYRVQGDPLTSNVADPTSAMPILSITQPYSNHNGGWVAFGPDGYLYIGMGDGGSGGDPQNNSQNLNSLLGKMLRIDINSGSPYAIPPTNPFIGVGRGEIWAYGLRNPWRNAFDRANGDLYMADVGQNAWEEIDYEPAATGGRNYGWRCYEGNAAYNTTGCQPPSAYVFPIYVYATGANCSITGGYVYRGCRMPGLQGVYFFADYCSARIWSFYYTPAGGVTNFQERTTELAPGGGLSIGTITSFGEDAAGELYIIDGAAGTGEVFKIIPRGVGDLNGDGAVNIADVPPFALALTDLAAYAAAYPTLDGFIRANLNGDCAIDGLDVQAMVDLLLP